MKKSKLAVSGASTAFLFAAANLPAYLSEQFDNPREIPFTEFANDAYNGKYAKIVISGNHAEAVVNEPAESEVKTVTPPDFSATQFLQPIDTHTTSVEFKPERGFIKRLFSGIYRTGHEHVVPFSLLISGYALFAMTIRPRIVKFQLKHMDKDEILNTAYHEAGHALAAILRPGIGTLGEITIIPKGDSLGSTEFLERKKFKSATKEMLFNEITIFFSGRAAEEVREGKDNYSVGSQEDLVMAKKIANRMVREYGMSNSIGPVSYAEEHPRKPISQKTLHRIEKEIEAILNNAYKEAQRLMSDHIKELESLALVLVEKKTLSEPEARRIVGRELPPLTSVDYIAS